MMMMAVEGRRNSDGGKNEEEVEVPPSGGGRASSVVTPEASLECDPQPEMEFPTPKLPRKRGSGGSNSNSSSTEFEGSPRGQVRRSSRLQEVKGYGEGEEVSKKPKPQPGQSKRKRSKLQQSNLERETETASAPQASPAAVEGEASKDDFNLDSLKISSDGGDGEGEEPGDEDVAGSARGILSALDLARSGRQASNSDVVLVWESRPLRPMLMPAETNPKGPAATATRPRSNPLMLRMFNNRAPQTKRVVDQKVKNDLVVGASQDAQPCSTITKRAGTPPNTSLVSPHLGRYASLSPYAQAICLSQDLDRQAAVHKQSMQALQMDLNLRDTLLKDNEDLRKSSQKYKELAEKERQRAEQVAKKLAYIQLHNSAKKMAAEQKYFSEQKFSDTVAQMKKEYEQRLKQIENNQQQTNKKTKDGIVKFQKGLISMLLRVVGKLAGDEAELELETVKRIVKKSTRPILGEYKAKKMVKTFTDCLEESWEEEDQLAESIYNGLIEGAGKDAAESKKRVRDGEELENFEVERPVKKARSGHEDEDHQEGIQIAQTSEVENRSHVQDQAMLSNANAASSLALGSEIEDIDDPDLVEALLLAVGNIFHDENLVLDVVREHEQSGVGEHNDEDSAGRSVEENGEAGADSGSSSSAEDSVEDSNTDNCPFPQLHQLDCNNDNDLAPKALVKIEVNSACHRHFNKLMNTPLDDLLGDRDFMVVFPSIFSIEDVALSIFAIIAQTPDDHPVKEEMVQDDRLVKSPLTLRFATLLTIVRDLSRLYRVKYLELPREFCQLFCQKIVDEDQGASDWMENEKLLSHLGGFFAAMHSIFGNEVNLGDVILTVGGVKGPLLYSFLYGIVQYDLGVLGFTPGLTGWGELPLWVRAVLFVVVKSPSFVQSSWRGRLTELMNSKGMEDVIPVGSDFDGFFETMLGEVCLIESEDELRKATKVVAMMAAHRGWAWFSNMVMVKGLLNKYAALFTEEEMNEKEKEFGEGILKGFGLGIAWMRRGNSPQNLDEVKSQFLRFKDARYPQTIQDAASFSLCLLEQIVLRYPSDNPIHWRYARKEPTAKLNKITEEVTNEPRVETTNDTVGVTVTSPEGLVGDGAELEEVVLVGVGGNGASGEEAIELFNLIENM